MRQRYTAVIVRSGEWFAGMVKELPGVRTQGKTITEVRENLKEAIPMVIESNLRHFTEYFEEEILVAL
ncbi:MAG: hypothetical protein B6245_23365 [Desulfobacteraceae bacterium 4572_88]|nr:MAG: hypothetical protein B6245_23365 [Desulfobacteraceae bacterium 4572_88]